MQLQFSSDVRPIYLEHINAEGEASITSLLIVSFKIGVIMQFPAQYKFLFKKKKKAYLVLESFTPLLSKKRISFFFFKQVGFGIIDSRQL